MNIACIGALNWDCKWQLHATLQLGTSNPVQAVTEHAGGVAFNIARRLAGLTSTPHSIHFVSALGDDAIARPLLAAVEQAQLVWRGCHCPGRRSGQYTALLDANGELTLGLAHMQLLQTLPPEFFVQALACLQTAQAAVIDLNVTQASLEPLCQAAQTLKPQGFRLAMVAASAPKMAHLPEDLSAVDLLLLNRDELRALLQLHLRSNNSDLSDGAEGADAALPGLALAEQVWPALHQRGLGALIVTAGADGALLCTPEAIRMQPAEPLPGQPTDVTGAGDALSATLLHAHWQLGLPLWEALARGQQAAATVLQHWEN